MENYGIISVEMFIYIRGLESWRSWGMFMIYIYIFVELIIVEIWTAFYSYIFESGLDILGWLIADFVLYEFVHDFLRSNLIVWKKGFLLIDKKKNLSSKKKLKGLIARIGLIKRQKR